MSEVRQRLSVVSNETLTRVSIAKTYGLCYNIRMRSHRTGELKRQVDQLKAAGMLQHTQSQRRHADEAIEAVPYFVIPSQAARRMGTLVMSFVHLDQRGILSLTAPKAYGVVERPTQATVPNAGLRLREAHVIAEDASLRRGIYTPYGRAASEIYVAKMVAEEGNAPHYLADRIGHLTALSSEIAQEEIFPRTGQVLGELERGVDSLEDYAQELGIPIK
jgi:hypothetical protein